MTPGLLRRAPTQHDLERLYHELALAGAPSVGRERRWPYRPRIREELLALAGEMLRHDPRLLSILLQWILESWPELDPQALRREMHRMRWPQALLVVFEFARVASREPELRYLADYLSAGFERVEPAERFFLDAERLGSRMARRKLGRTLAPYARWGFLATERPVADVGTKRAVGRYDRRTRLRILEDLLARSGEVTLAGYLEAADHAVSRQQAREDLASHPDLVAVGRGRGARWVSRRDGAGGSS